MTHLLDAVKALAIIVPVAIGARCAHDGHAIQPCPARWYVNGVTPGGLYRCRPVLGDPGRDIIDAVAQLAIQDDRETYGLLHCTGGSVPVHDGSSVWCDRNAR